MTPTLRLPRAAAVLLATLALPLFLQIAALRLVAADSDRPAFRVATYNLENYLDAPAGTRPLKTAEARAKIRESIIAARPDVLALQEIGSTNTLLELRGSLAAAGLDLPHWEYVTGADTNIHVAILSRFPFIARRPHTNESFVLGGRQRHVSRGFAEVDIRVSPSYSVTIITAHLKSRRPIPEADEAELREQEALQLRALIDTRLNAQPDLNLVVLGDFNDVKDATSTRAIVGRGRHALVDTRPAERNGDDAASRLNERQITWTHYYEKEDTYSRIDYIFISRGMAKEWVAEETYIPRVSNWGIGSDHRPIVASFLTVDQ